MDARDQSLAKLSALDGWGATSSEKVLDALETRAATPIPLAAFVFALGAPRIGKATAKRVAGISGSWAALRRSLSPTTAADDALRTALAEARGVGPAAVEGLLEFFAKRRTPRWRTGWRRGLMWWTMIHKLLLCEEPPRVRAVGIPRSILRDDVGQVGRAAAKGFRRTGPVCARKSGNPPAACTARGKGTFLCVLVLLHI